MVERGDGGEIDRPGVYSGGSAGERSLREAPCMEMAAFGRGTVK